MNIRKIERLIRRVFGLSKYNTRGFSAHPDSIRVSQNALEVVRRIRGECRAPAIIIHGVMPRSGTVYTGEILRLHPVLYAYPNELWEVPFLELTGDIIEVQKHFFRAYKQNANKMGENDFLPLFGASLIAYLHSFVPEGKRILIKIPDVQYLSYFHTVFPNENILMLLRDGRDVVNSTIRTWPDKSFSNVCRQWDLSTKAMLEFWDKNKGNPSGLWLTKYEDVVRDPENFARNACEQFQLNQENFPFESIKNISVRGSSSIKSKGKVTWNASEKPKGFNPVGRWQNWSKRRKMMFKKIAGETLIAAGYCDDQGW